MLDTPAISVVIPTYNAAKFLREALDSLLAQTFTNWEAVCVNDGSTDNSLEILQEYAARDSRFRILDGPNGGYGKAMNRGMDAAAGKYLAILEPDDFLTPQAYEHLIARMEGQETDIVRGAHCRFYQGDSGYVYSLSADSYVKEKAIHPREHHSVFYFAPNNWASLYRIEFLRRYGLYHHESPGASYQDVSFYFQVLAHARSMVMTDEVVYLYRQDNPNSSMNSVDAKWQAITREYEYLKGQLQRFPELWAELRCLYYAKLMESHLWFYHRVAEGRREGFATLFRDTVKDIPQSDLAEILPRHRDALEALRHSPQAFMEHEMAYAPRAGRIPAKPAAPQPSLRRELCREICPGVVIPYGHEDSWTVLGVRVLRKRCSAQQTALYILGVPVWKRTREIAVERRPANNAYAVYRHTYRIIGVPYKVVKEPVSHSAV